MALVMNVDRESAAPPSPLSVPWTTLAAPSGRLTMYQATNATLPHLSHFLSMTDHTFGMHSRSQRVIPRPPDTQGGGGQRKSLDTLGQRLVVTEGRKQFFGLLLMPDHVGTRGR